MRSALLLLVVVFGIIGCKNTESRNQLENTTETETPTLVLNNTQREQISNSHLIIPGNKLGDIRLNSLASAVYDSLGKPTSGDAAMQKSVSTWDSGSDVLTIFSANDPNTSEGHLIKLIRSTAAEFKTKDGIGKGTSMTDIEEKFKIEKAGTFTENGADHTLYDTHTGISFEFNSQNICTGVVIHNPEIQPGITYLPMYEKFVPAIN